MGTDLPSREWSATQPRCQAPNLDVVDCPGLVAASAQGRPQNVAQATAQMVKCLEVLGWNSHRGSVAPKGLGGGNPRDRCFFSGWKYIFVFFSLHFNGKSPKCLCSRLYLGRAGWVLRDLWNGEGHEWQELRNTFSFFSFYFSQLRSIELRKFQTTHDQATQKHECFSGNIPKESLLQISFWCGSSPLKVVEISMAQLFIIPVQMGDQGFKDEFEGRNYCM